MSEEKQTEVIEEKNQETKSGDEFEFQTWRKENRKPLTLMISLVLLSMVGIWYTQTLAEQDIVTVYVQGEKLFQVDLSSVKESYTYDVVQGSHFNQILFETNAVSVVEANCPDQVCVLQGKSSEAGRPIVCLPHQVLIEFVSEGDEFDAVVG